MVPKPEWSSGGETAVQVGRAGYAVCRSDVPWGLLCYIEIVEISSLVPHMNRGIQVRSDKKTADLISRATHPLLCCAWRSENDLRYWQEVFERRGLPDRGVLGDEDSRVDRLSGEAQGQILGCGVHGGRYWEIQARG